MTRVISGKSSIAIVLGDGEGTVFVVDFPNAHAASLAALADVVGDAVFAEHFVGTFLATEEEGVFSLLVAVGEVEDPKALAEAVAHDAVAAYDHGGVELEPSLAVADIEADADGVAVGAEFGDAEGVALGHQGVAVAVGELPGGMEAVVADVVGCCHDGVVGGAELAVGFVFAGGGEQECRDGDYQVFLHKGRLKIRVQIYEKYLNLQR